MANELTINTSLKLTRVNTETKWESGNLSFNQAGSRFLKNVLSVTTTPQLIPLIGGTVGYAMLRNIYTTSGNVIYLLAALTGGRLIQLDAGEVALFKLGPDVAAPAVSLQTGGTTTTAQLEYLLVEL